MNILIRPATSPDFDKLARMISSDIAWNRYGIDYRVALQLINSAEDQFYLAVVNQEVVGFCALRLNGVGNIGSYIRMIVVAESHRGQGIGKKLLDYVWNLSILYIPNVFLICSTDNIRAQKFYEREGFKKVGLLEDLVVPGHDEILYWKSSGSLKN